MEGFAGLIMLHRVYFGRSNFYRFRESKSIDSPILGICLASSNKCLAPSGLNGSVIQHWICKGLDLYCS